jgi:small subunit ribosomal protein S17
MPKRVLQGVVTADKTAKTRRVEIARMVQHPVYLKYIRKRTVCYVHDENNESHVGDVVEIVECRPMSAMKRWQLVRVIERNKAVDLAQLRATRRSAAEEEALQVTHSTEEATGGNAST